MSSFYQNEDINTKVKAFLEESSLVKAGSKFGYFIISKRDLNDITIINNHPVWFDLYVKHSHQMVDPVVMKALYRVESFDWDEEIIISSKLALPKVMLHAKEYDINNGHTFIIHDYRNNLALFSVFDDGLAKTEKGHSSDLEHQFYLFVKAHQKLLSLYDFFEKDSQFSSVNITARENEILYWAAIGKTYKEIATLLNITMARVNNE